MFWIKEREREREKKVSEYETKSGLQMLFVVSKKMNANEIHLNRKKVPKNATSKKKKRSLPYDFFLESKFTYFFLQIVVK